MQHITTVIGMASISNRQFRCYCGALVTSIERDTNHLIDVTSMRDARREFMATHITLTVTCEAGHISYAHEIAEQPATTRDEPRELKSKNYVEGEVMEGEIVDYNDTDTDTDNDDCWE